MLPLMEPVPRSPPPPVVPHRRPAPTAWVHIHRLRAAVGAARRSGLAQGPAIQADWAALLRRVQGRQRRGPNTL